MDPPPQCPLLPDPTSRSRVDLRVQGHSRTTMAVPLLLQAQPRALALV